MNVQCVFVFVTDYVHVNGERQNDYSILCFIHKLTDTS